MRFFTAIVLTMLLAFIAGLYFEWWSVAVAAFLVALLIFQVPWKSFLSGFLGVFLLWVGLSSWIDSKNEQILSARIGELLGIGANSFLLIIITGLIGAIVAGTAALSGCYLKAARRERDGVV